MIYSIFGQIDAVVAEAMVTEGKARRIDREDFPDMAICPEVHFNAAGHPAQFAIVLDKHYIPEFETRIADLRS